VDGQKTVDTVRFDTSRGQANANVSHAQGDVAGRVGLNFESGYLEASAGRAEGIKGDAHLINSFVGATKNVLFVGVSNAQTLGTDTTKQVGFIAVSADRSITDLGAYQGSHPALKGTRKVEVKKAVGGAVALSAGWMASVAGFGGRMRVDKGKNISFTTHLATEDAKKALLEGGGVVGFFRNKSRALGATKDVVTIPDVAAPQTLRPGDTLVVRTIGSIMGGVAVGNLAIRGGMTAEVRGDFEVRVSKLDDQKVEVSVTPVNVRGTDVFIDTPLIADFSKTHVEGSALRQTYVFDLSKPAAAAAYQRCIAGEPPLALSAGTDATDLRTLVHDQQLGEGVTCTLLEKVENENRAVGGGLNWGLIQEWTGIAGLSYRVVRSQEQGTITDGVHTLETSTSAVERRREVLLSGNESVGVTASGQFVTSYDNPDDPQRDFVGLTLRAHYSDDRVRGLELNDEVVDDINHAFGSSVPHFEREGRGQTRLVTLTRTLSALDFRALETASAERVAEAARESGAKERDLKALQASLTSNPNIEAQCNAVQAYIVEAGTSGLGALHRVLGDVPALKVDTTSNAYVQPIQESGLMALKHQTPIAADEPLDNVVARFEEVQTLQSKVGSSFLDALDDGFLSEEDRKATAERLQAAWNTLDTLVDVTHLRPEQRAAMHAELDAGWTTDMEYTLMAHLAAAGLE
jgi:hypothetical protein